MEKFLYGKPTGKSGVVKLYTEKSHRRMQNLRIFFLLAFSPFWVPYYLLIFIGQWSEYIIDKADNLLDKILMKIIPN